MKNYYQLLDVQPAASAEEIKRAFRQQIARYHPDKVQHLGAEFQALAADRAAELTEAYRVLSDPASRAEYDRVFSSAATATPAETRPEPPRPAARPEPPPPSPVEPPAPDERRSTPSDERARSNEYVRRAAVARVQHALDAVMDGSFDRPSVRGFDLAVVPKPKLFGRPGGPRMLVRFVGRVDAPAIADAWVSALKWRASAAEEICVMLMGSDMAARGELAAAIDEQRRKSRGAKMTLVPVDARDWQAHVPVDAPPVVRTVLDRLRNPAG